MPVGNPAASIPSEPRGPRGLRRPTRASRFPLPGRHRAQGLLAHQHPEPLRHLQQGQRPRIVPGAPRPVGAKGPGPLVSVRRCGWEKERRGYFRMSSCSGRRVTRLRNSRALRMGARKDSRPASSVRKWRPGRPVTQSGWALNCRWRGVSHCRASDRLPGLPQLASPGGPAFRLGAYAFLMRCSSRSAKHCGARRGRHISGLRNAPARRSRIED